MIVVDGNSKAPFSTATTPRCRGERSSFSWISSLYQWWLPYNAKRYARWHQVSYSETLVWLDLGLKPSLTVPWWTFYPLSQYIYTYIYVHIYLYIHICMYIYRYVHIYMYLYICVYIYVYICICVCVCVCVCVCDPQPTTRLCVSRERRPIILQDVILVAEQFLIWQSKWSSDLQQFSSY